MMQRLWREVFFFFNLLCYTLKKKKKKTFFCHICFLLLISSAFLSTKRFVTHINPHSRSLRMYHNKEGIGLYICWASVLP